MGEKPVFFVKSAKMEKLKIEWKAFIPDRASVHT